MKTKQLLRGLIISYLSVGLLACASQLEIESSVTKINKPDYEQGVAAYNEHKFDRALDIWADVASEGNVDAINALGLMYQSGRGVSRDVGAAARLYKKAARAGLASAQNNLAALYEGGEGVPQDMAVAVDLYRRAAAQGYASAQYNLGRLHAAGIGVEKDAALATEYFHQAEESRRLEKEMAAVVPNR